ELLELDDIQSMLEGSRCDVAVLFVDICGFTRITSTLSAHDVRRLLDEFYAEVVPHILDHDGTVVNFIGDEIYAVFGAPLKVDGYAVEAFECAVEIQRRRSLAATRFDSGPLQGVGYSIGLHAGEAVAAHVGNDFRRQYTIVGDTVNVGSRLCGRAGFGEI